MKKSIFMIGCAVMLSLSMVFTGCKKNDDESTNSSGGGGGGEPPINNVISFDGNNYDISNAVYANDDDVTTIAFSNQNNEFIFVVNFWNTTTIPTGTYDISIEGTSTCYGYFYQNYYEYGVKSGSITITKNGDIYTVKAYGIATSVGRQDCEFSVSYSGIITDYNAPAGNGNLVIDGTTYALTTGFYTVQTESIYNIMLISLLSEDENTSIGFAFLNNTTIPIGTFALSNNPMLGCMSVVSTPNNDYASVSGNITISKSGENYTITCNGIGELSDYKETINFSCNYTGTLSQMTKRHLVKFPTIK